jgi:hypothetical protein
MGEDEGEGPITARYSARDSRFRLRTPRVPAFCPRVIQSEAKNPGEFFASPTIGEADARHRAPDEGQPPSAIV